MATALAENISPTAFDKYGHESQYELLTAAAVRESSLKKITAKGSRQRTN